LKYNTTSSTWNWPRNGREASAAEWHTNFPRSGFLSDGNIYSVMVKDTRAVDSKGTVAYRFVCELWY